MYKPKLKLERRLKSLGRFSRILELGFMKLRLHNPGMETSETVGEYSDKPITLDPYSQRELNRMSSYKAEALLALDRHKRIL